MLTFAEIARLVIKTNRLFDKQIFQLPYYSFNKHSAVIMNLYWYCFSSRKYTLKFSKQHVQNISKITEFSGRQPKFDDDL